MADYIYLLENRLSPAQRSAIRHVREIARAKGLTSFLVGGAVRDLTSGSPVRDLDLVLQGNATKLRKDLEKAGAVIVGEHEPGQTLFVRFPGSVRMEVGSTLSVTFPKPGKPVYKSATILEDLRRRDFTANAMALSLNEGSYGLLMDPLNGIADIENRQLRLVSNYGFIEDPVRMIRAARLMARLGWELDERTQTRYEAGKTEGYISALSEFHRGYETEELVHEEDPLRVMKRLEAEGWLKVLAPYWNASKVNVVELERLREIQTQLQMQGLHPSTAAANFPLLTAKLTPKEVSSLKAGFPSQGFVEEIDALEAEGKDFTAKLSNKAASAASASWKLITSSRPEAVLWTAFTSKSATLQAKFKSFYQDWPQVRTRIPYVMMQEMRIVPDLPGYDELLETIFFELMDGKLTTPEEMKAFLEPHSPPAPPPPVSLRRPRAAKKETKSARVRAKKAATEDVPLTPEAAGETVPAPASAVSSGQTNSPEVTRAAPQKPARPAGKSAKPVAPAPEAVEAAKKPAAAKPPAPEKLPAAAAHAAPAKVAAAGPAAPKGVLKKGTTGTGKSKSGAAAGKKISAAKSAPANKSKAAPKPAPGKKSAAAGKPAPSKPAKTLQVRAAAKKAPGKSVPSKKSPRFAPAKPAKAPAKAAKSSAKNPAKSARPAAKKVPAKGGKPPAKAAKSAGRGKPAPAKSSGRR